MNSFWNNPWEVRDRSVMDLTHFNLFRGNVLHTYFSWLLYVYYHIYLFGMASTRSLYLFFFSKRHTGLKSVPQNMQWEVFCVI